MLDALFGQDYYLARLIFQRTLALIYLFAFLVALNQFKPLLGENGLLPVPRFLQFVKFSQAPSIFHFHYSDSFFTLIAWLGISISIILVLGLVDNLPWGISALLWTLLWVLYLSIVNVGQVFYGFGWESMLLEVGFLAIFMGSNKNMVPIVLIFLLRWILFRIEFGAGLIKMRGDSCWRDLTCLDYHHETQPMPNPLSWYFHNMPAWFHRCEVAGNHFFQLVVPWGLFLPQPFAAISAGLIMISQFWLVLSGNFSWLNWMTILLAVSGFSDGLLRRIITMAIPASFAAAPVHQAVVVAVSLLIIYLSYMPVRNMLSKHQAMNASFNPFHIVNTYGAFGSVTKKRYEIILEATQDETVTDTTQWLEYEFKGKPGDLKRRPPQCAPYHLRLDWLMWFASFGFDHQRHWFLPFVEKLLKHDQAVLKLLRYNPFPDKPPVHIRARFYHYKFTNLEERKQTGQWWKRELVGEYLPLMSLR